jgi:hypothetical protein
MAQSLLLLLLLMMMMIGVEFEALTVVTIKIKVFWVVTVCSSESDVSEEHIASIFRVEKPNNKLEEADGKMSVPHLKNPALNTPA